MGALGRTRLRRLRGRSGEDPGGRHSPRGDQPLGLRRVLLHEDADLAPYGVDCAKGGTRTMHVRRSPCLACGRTTRPISELVEETSMRGNLRHPHHVFQPVLEPRALVSGPWRRRASLAGGDGPAPEMSLALEVARRVLGRRRMSTWRFHHEPALQDDPSLAAPRSCATRAARRPSRARYPHADIPDAPGETRPRSRADPQLPRRHCIMTDRAADPARPDEPSSPHDRPDRLRHVLTRSPSSAQRRATRLTR